MHSILQHFSQYLKFYFCVWFTSLQIGVSAGPECKAALQEITRLVDGQLQCGRNSVKELFGATKVSICDMKCIFQLTQLFSPILFAITSFKKIMLNDLTYCVDGFGMHEEENANLKRVVVLKRECIFNIDSSISFISFLLYTSYHIRGWSLSISTLLLLATSEQSIEELYVHASRAYPFSDVSNLSILPILLFGLSFSYINVCAVYHICTRKTCLNL